MSQLADLVYHFKNLRAEHNLTLEWDVLDGDAPEDYQEKLNAEYDAIRQMLTSF